MGQLRSVVKLHLVAVVPFTRVSTSSPVPQADVGLLFWRFSGAGGFSYRQLEARCYQVCFSAVCWPQLPQKWFIRMV